jgi:hypothetical protein
MKILFLDLLQNIPKNTYAYILCLKMLADGETTKFLGVLRELQYDVGRPVRPNFLTRAGLYVSPGTNRKYYFNSYLRSFGEYDNINLKFFQNNGGMHGVYVNKASKIFILKINNCVLNSNLKLRDL